MSTKGGVLGLVDVEPRGVDVKFRRVSLAARRDRAGTLELEVNAIPDGVDAGMGEMDIIPVYPSGYADSRVFLAYIKDQDVRKDRSAPWSLKKTFPNAGPFTHVVLMFGPDVVALRLIREAPADQMFSIAQPSALTG